MRAIRYALRDLYGLVAEQIETEDKNALIDFFSLADQGASAQGRKKRSRKPKPDVQPREKAIRVIGRTGGFEIASGPGAAKWEFPRTIRVRLAYDMIGGNPFKHHSRFDFDLTQKGIDLACDNVQVKPLRPNVLIMEVQSEDFRLEAGGFDQNRDLVVDARAL